MLTRSYLMKFEKAKKESKCSHRAHRESNNAVACSLCDVTIEKKDISVGNEYNIPVLIDLIKIYCGVEALDLLDSSDPDFERELMSLYYVGVFPNIDPKREEKERIHSDMKLVNLINMKYHGDTFKEPESGKYYCCTDSGFLLLNTRGEIIEFRNTHKPTHSSINVRALGASMSYTVNVNKTLAKRLCAHEIGYRDEKYISCKHCGLELSTRVMRHVNEGNYLEAIDYLKFFLSRDIITNPDTILQFRSKDYMFIEELLLKVATDHNLLSRDEGLQNIIIRDLLDIADTISDRQLILVAVKDPAKIDSSDGIKRYINKEFNNVMIEFIASRTQNLDYNINILSRDLFYTTIIPLLKQK